MRKHLGWAMSSRLMPPKAGVDPAEIFEEQRLALHDGQPGLRPDIPQAKHPGPIGDDRDAVGLVGVFIDQLGLTLNGLAGRGDARRVPDREIGQPADGTLRHHLHLPLVKRMQAHGVLGRALGPGQQFCSREHSSTSLVDYFLFGGHLDDRV